MDSQDWDTNGRHSSLGAQMFEMQKNRIVKHIQELKIENGK
jgi:hypothetical protein